MKKSPAETPGFLFSVSFVIASGAKQSS